VKQLGDLDMTKTSYIAVCAVAAVGLGFASPKAASAFPAAPGAEKTYTQTVTGSASIPVRWGGVGGWGGRGIGWGGRGIGFGRGIGWGGRGWGWRGGGWGWPVGLGLGLAAAGAYPYYGGYYPGYSGGYYGGCGCGW
jgi:hypothetical protein